MSNSSPNSGDGSRPTTDGGVDNLGAGKSFNPERPEDSGPAAEHVASHHMADRATARQDGSAPLGLRDAAESVPNSEPPKTAHENNAERR